MNNIVPVGTGQAPIFKKQSGIGQALYMQTMGQPIWSQRDYAAFAREGYTQNAVVFRCIRLIVETAKSIPLLVYKDDQPVEEHPFLDLIARPNPITSGVDLLDALYSYLMIAGNSFLEAVPLRGQIAELYVLRPDRMKVVVDKRGYPSEYRYKVGNVEEVYAQPKTGQLTIMHLKTFNPLNDFYGLSPIEPAAKAIDTHNAAGAYNASLLQNMGRPSGALMVKGDDGQEQLTADQFERLKTQIEGQMSGAQAAGKPLLLEGGLEWVPFSQTSQDMEFTEGKNSAARDIAQAMGTPPQLLGIPGDNTYSNLKEANVAFARQTILPIVTKVCQAMSLFLTPTYGEDFKVWYDIDEVAGLVGEREEKWKMVNESTILTVNEKREAIGYDERDEGDVILVSSSMIPLDEDLGDEATSEEDITDPEASDPNEEGEETTDGTEDGGGDPA